MGCCPLGFPLLLPENVDPITIWNDVQAYGWGYVRDTWDLDLDETEAGRMRLKLRILADVFGAWRREQIKKQTKGS